MSQQTELPELDSVVSTDHPGLALFTSFCSFP